MVLLLILFVFLEFYVNISTREADIRKKYLSYSKKRIKAKTKKANRTEKEKGTLDRYFSKPISENAEEEAESQNNAYDNNEGRQSEEVMQDN